MHGAELTAMTDSMGKLIRDIDKLDGYRITMMEELKQLRDITLYYDKLYLELHEEDSMRQHQTKEKTTHERPTLDSKEKDSKKNN